MNEAESSLIIPADLQQSLPRSTRLASGGAFYVVGGFIVSAFILTFVVLMLSHTAKQVKNGRELASRGRVAYTGDVRAGGVHLTTAYYSFIYEGQSYRGEALLPIRYLGKVLDDRKSGDFPVVFLPNDPSINHPYDWGNDESYSFAFVAYVGIVIFVIEWIVLGRLIIQDLRLARNGIVAIGEVTRCSYARGGMKLSYDFRDKDDLPADGCGVSPVGQKPGAKICILYLPEKPGNSRPYPLVFIRAVR